MPGASIENKWPDFEKAFLGFKPAKLTFQPDEFWDGLLSDKRIVRNGAKIMSVRDNAAFVQAIAKEYGSFGKFLGQWPASDEIGLLDLLTKRGSRLGGNTGQMFLRFVGWDGFVTSKDVVACLRDAGLDIAEEVKSKGDLAKVQAAFNAWAKESGLPYAHMSRICALSIGRNMLISRNDVDLSARPCGMHFRNCFTACTCRDEGSNVARNMIRPRKLKKKTTRAE